MFRILGTFMRDSSDGQSSLGPPKQQLTLALLLSNAGVALTTGHLIDAIWEDKAPRTARKNLQVYIAALRKLMMPTVEEISITSTVTGYRLEAASGALDWLEFDRLAREGGTALRAGSKEAAAELFDRALALWRGEPLGEFRGNTEIAQTAGRMTRRRLSIIEEWADAVIALGEPGAVLERLDEAALLDPMRDRLRALQISALARLGLRAQALSVYDDVRRQLSHDYGLEPGAAVEAAHQLALSARQTPAQNPARRCRVLLPPNPAAFTGRHELLESLGSPLLRGGSRIVLHGPLGIGKSSVAVRAARTAAPGFEDGCVFVKLTDMRGKARAPISVLTELWHTAGIADVQPDDADVAYAVWRAHAAARSFLLILDDVPDEAAASSLVPETARSTVLLTSRSALPRLEATCRLLIPPLTRAEAWALLATLAGRERIEREPEAVDRIIDICGATPSALRAVGTRMSSASKLRPRHLAELLENPDERLDLLAPDPPALAELGRSWSARLPSTVAADLRRLAALPHPRFGIEQAQRLWRLQDPAQAYDRLGKLTSHSLVAEASGEVVAHAADFELPPVVWWLLRGRLL